MIGIVGNNRTGSKVGSPIEAHAGAKPKPCRWAYYLHWIKRLASCFEIINGSKCSRFKENDLIRFLTRFLSKVIVKCF